MHLNLFKNLGHTICNCKASIFVVVIVYNLDISKYVVLLPYGY